MWCECVPASCFTSMNAQSSCSFLDVTHCRGRLEPEVDFCKCESSRQFFVLYDFHILTRKNADTCFEHVSNWPTSKSTLTSFNKQSICWLHYTRRGSSQSLTHFEVQMDNFLGMDVVHTLEDFSHKFFTGWLVQFKALVNDPLEEFATRDSENNIANVNVYCIYLMHYKE